MFVQCRLRKLQQAEKLSMPIQGLQWVPRQGFAFPEKKDWKLIKNILSNYRSDFIKTLHTVFIAQKLLKNANEQKNYQCRYKAYSGDHAKALLSLKNKVIIHEYGRYNVASMYVGGRAVSSFENCSTNVLIKVMGVKALSSATFSFKKSYKIGYPPC